MKLSLLSALMAGKAPGSILGVPPHKPGDIWSLADRSAREITAWSAKKIAQADHALPSKDRK